MNKCTYINVYNLWVWALILINAYISIYMYMHVWICMYTYINVCVHMHTLAYIRVHTYMNYTYVHIHKGHNKYMYISFPIQEKCNSIYSFYTMHVSEVYITSLYTRGQWCIFILYHVEWLHSVCLTQYILHSTHEGKWTYTHMYVHISVWIYISDTGKEQCTYLLYTMYSSLYTRGQRFGRVHAMRMYIYTCMCTVCT